MANTLEVIIKAIDNATVPINKISGSFSGLNKVLGAVGIGISAVAVISFLKDASHEAIESEKAVSRLSNTVNQLGLSYKLLENKIQAQVQATSNYAIVQDELASDTLQQLILQTGNVGDSLKNLNLVFDLSRAANVDASTAATMFSKALLGETDTLGRAFPAFKKVSEELGDNATRTDKSAAALKFFEERVKGATASMGELEARSLKTNKAIGDFKEEIGKLAGNIITEAITNIIAYRDAFVKFGIAIEQVISKIPLLNKLIEPLSKTDVSKFGTALEGVNSILADNALKLEASNKKAKEKSDHDKEGAVALGTLIQAQARYDQVIAPLAAKLSAMGLSFKDLGIDQAALRTSVEAQTKAQEALDVIFKGSQEHLGGLIAAQGRYTKTIEPFVNKLQDAGITMESLGVDASTVKTSIEEQNKVLEKGTESWGKMQEALGEVIKDRAVKDWAKKQAESWDNFFVSINATTDAIGVGLGSAFGSMIATGQSFGEAMKNVFRSWAAEAINQITKVLVKMAVLKIFEFATGGLGGVAEVFGPAFHSGGIIKAHSGINLAHDEVPIIAQRGEAVLNRGAVSRLGKGGVDALNRGSGGRNITVVNNVSGPAIFDQLSMAKWTRRQLKAINAEMMRYA